MSVALAKPLIGDDERAAVDRVMRSGMIAQGPEVKAFEDDFAALVGDRECVAVSSGTSALHLALLAVGIGPGDEVIVPSFTFAATANSVRLAGGEPVFVDIDAATFNLDPEAVAAAVTERTAAIMPVHLYGQPADMTALGAIADRHGLLLVEDAAQAHGATWRGEPVGSFGRAACFSFYPTKNMTTGEGGMVACAEAADARMVRLLRNQGMERRYENEVVGFNVRMTDIAAAIGRVQLSRLDGWTKTRQANAAVYDEQLAGLEGVVTPVVADEATHVYHQYTLRCDDRAAVQAALEEAGVGFGVYYPTPVHRLPSFRMELDLPVTEAAAATALSLPIGPHLDEDDLAQVVAAVRAGAGSSR